MLEIDLQSDIGLKPLAALAARHGDAIARVAGMATRLFLLQSHSAPGLRFVGGEVDAKCLAWPGALQRSFSLAGSAEVLEDALAACIGEGLSACRKSSDRAMWRASARMARRCTRSCRQRCR